MENKFKLIAAAASGLALGLSVANAADKKADESVQCYGIQTKKDVNGCGIGDKEIAAANKAFNNKFAKSKTADCAGNISGSASDGVLAWLSLASKKDCFAKNGFLMTAEKDGTFKVEKK